MARTIPSRFLILLLKRSEELPQHNRPWAVPSRSHTLRWCSAGQKLPIFRLQPAQSLADHASEQAGKILSVPLLGLARQAAKELGEGFSRRRLRGDPAQNITRY